MVRPRDTRVLLGRDKHTYHLLEVRVGPNVLGQSEFGRAGASVSFRKRDCSWGLLDQEKAGVLRFQTNRYEPQGYKLRTLTVELSFDDRLPDDVLNQSNTSVYILLRPEPAIVKGGETSRSEERNLNLNPNIPVPTGSFTLGSIGQKSTYNRKGHWTYSSSWFRTTGQRYGTAVWEWQANDANPELEDIGDLHGGVVLTHADQPFYLRCKIEGKLVSFTADTRSTAKKWFRFRSKKLDNPSSYRIIPEVDAQSDLSQLVSELGATLEALIRQSSATFLEKKN